MKEPSDEANEWSGRVIGAAIEVHRVLGPGFPERTYGDALAIELRYRKVPFRREAPVETRYRDVLVYEGQADFIVAETVVVELKAIEALLPVHSHQLITYLRATGLDLGLLLNFHARSLREGIKRVVFSLS